MRRSLEANLPRPSAGMAGQPFAIAQTWRYEHKFTSARAVPRLSYWSRSQDGVAARLLRDVAIPGTAPVAAAYLVDNLQAPKRIALEVRLMGVEGGIDRNFDVVHTAWGAVILREGIDMAETRQEAAAGRLHRLVRVLVESSGSRHDALACRRETGALLARVGESLGDGAGLALDPAGG